MSSVDVRTVVTNEMNAWSAAQSIPWYDMSDFTDAEDLATAPFVLIQHMDSDEELVSLAGGAKGYVEIGFIYVHLVVDNTTPPADVMVIGETLYPMLGDRRLGHIVFDPMDEFTDQAGESIQVDGPYRGWTAAVYFERSLFQ